ncbi:cuticle protein 18.7-like [Macrosteles quadrilineatus]|uniref:cuticle protein 18.7-like n=1 Tax=Macrosteles quadrilineatus TaxID=74068 RepID=UPI0023E11BAB|nr:cuticle protein 18.7-like [Macrosteles quadrilineatus]
MDKIVIVTLALLSTIEGAFIPGDTPEVALAKVAHFAEHIKEAARAAGHQPAPTYYVSVEENGGYANARMPVTYITDPASRMPVAYASAPAAVTYVPASEAAARIPVTYISAPTYASYAPTSEAATRMPVSYISGMPVIYAPAPVAAATKMPAPMMPALMMPMMHQADMHDHARAAAAAAAMGSAASAAGAGFPYVDFYKSLADYYASTSNHPMSSSV